MQGLIRVLDAVTASKTGINDIYFDFFRLEHKPKIQCIYCIKDVWFQVLL
jgi:hypothetical protein